MLLATITKYLPRENIIFVVSNFNDKMSNSSDVDIYCVTTGKSFVECFYDEKHKWTELFVDNIFDVHKKIENVDEIAINFIRELKFAFGNYEAYSEMLQKATLRAENYSLPSYRKNLLKYRVKVLLSKYTNPDAVNLAQQNFIINSISYPLIQLVLESNRIFPSSPKRWLLQLQSALPMVEFETLERFLSHKCSAKEAVAICERYAGNLDSISIEKGGVNDTTFLS